MTPGQRSLSASSSQADTIKFPDLSIHPPAHEHAVAEQEDSPSLPPISEGPAALGGWAPHRKKRVSWSNGHIQPTKKHNRQKSLNEAIRTIRGRRASVSENAHEIADALKVPVSPGLVLLCGFWFMTSIFSNASSKSILIAFRRPVTLTLVQFAFVSTWCIVASSLAHRYPIIQKWVPALRYSIRSPSKDIILATLPLTAFQIGGHILNSDAMARIPVSLVHTIKGLSPLFTVIAYRLFFGARYSIYTYLSLIPLTSGVMMACSANIVGDFLGLLCAFGSTILFVTQNIASKKLFNEAARAEAEGQDPISGARKPDKLNLLCYSSGLAFLITFPIWGWSEGATILSEFLNRGAVELSDRPDALDHGRLTLEFIFNGTFHFAQSLVAFILLSMISPVTYSVASLVKRVFVISFAFVWFGNRVTRVQAVGIVTTFVGLYFYDRTNDAARVDKRLRLMEDRAKEPLLPVNKADGGHTYRFKAHAPNGTAAPNGAFSMFSPANHGSQKRRLSDALKREHAPQDPAADGWLPPGTKQEHTWKSQEFRDSPKAIAA